MAMEFEPFERGSADGDTRRPPWKAVSVLLVGRSARGSDRLRRRLARHFGLVEFAEDIASAQALLPRCHFDCVIVDIEAPDSPAIVWLERLGGAVRAIVTADRTRPEIAAAALRAGAADIVLKPVEPEELLAAVHRLCLATLPLAARDGSSKQVAARHRHRLLVGESSQIRAVRQLIARVAPLPATVLVEGETGTGKELVARLLHEQSGRRGPFVPVNCGAIAPELMESELFGHAKGAFTGAHQIREGLFASARAGTLFLDEIGEMRPDLQVKLLRALEEGAVRPVGSDREVAVDARIVASTQPGLGEKVERGAFREDLFYRLNVIHIVLPPLRERPDDIAVLASHFMAAVASENGMPARPLDADEMQWLESQPWPGNVRELRNVIERAVLLGEMSRPDTEEITASGSAPVQAYPLEWTLEEVKQHHMQRVLDASNGNRSAAARKLGVSRKTLERKLGPASPARNGNRE